MNRITLNDGIARAAARCVWYKPVDQALADPIDFAAHILTYGLHEDVKALRAQLSDDDLREALDKAPAGVIDERSWSYWNAKLGRYPAPPLPSRRLG